MTVFTQVRILCNSEGMHVGLRASLVTMCSLLRGKTGRFSPSSIRIAYNTVNNHSLIKAVERSIRSVLAASLSADVKRIGLGEIPCCLQTML